MFGYNICTYGAEVPCAYQAQGFKLVHKGGAKDWVFRCTRSDPTPEQLQSRIEITRALDEILALGAPDLVSNELNN